MQDQDEEEEGFLWDVLGLEQHHAAGRGGISSVGIISASDNPHTFTGYLLSARCDS